jgi:hypothetical protein
VKQYVAEVSVQRDFFTFVVTAENEGAAANRAYERAMDSVTVEVEEVYEK